MELRKIDLDELQILEESNENFLNWGLGCGTICGGAGCGSGCGGLFCF